MTHQLLDWDTQFFGFKVARILQHDLPLPDLSLLLAQLRRDGIQLVYWSLPQPLDEADVAPLGGRLVDAKTTFAMRLPPLGEPIDGVEPFDVGMPEDDVEALAIQSGEYSRFAVDPRFPREKFVELYRLWIRRSLCKEIADEVLVLRHDERIVGMVTLSEKNGRGDVGLLAVAAEHRGKRLGEKLVLAAQRYFVTRGYQHGQVVTQGANLPACNLYKRCGYSVEKIEYLHHFWL